MGQGALLRIVNATPHKLKETKRDKPYQIGFNPPQSVDPNTGKQFYMEFDCGFFKDPWDDNGKIWYGLEKTSLSFNLIANGVIAPGLKFELTYQCDFDKTIKPASLPFYLFSHTGQDKYGLLDKDKKYISKNIVDINGRYPFYILKIIHLAQFAKNEMEAIEMAGYIMNAEQDNPRFKAFMDEINRRIDAMPFTD